MFELFNLQFFLGLIFGGLIVFGIYPYIFKKKEQDLSTFESNLQFQGNLYPLITND